MRSKLKIITESGRFLGLFVLTASLTLSCSNRSSKTASVGNNPYSSNPYYSSSGPSDSSSTASSAGSSQYPTYDDSASYTPPPVPAQTEAYPSYSDTNTYPSYTGAPASNTNSYPVDTGYTGGGFSSGSGTAHTVASGENLYRISLQYGTTVSAIQSANGLGTTTIFPGQVIRIP